MPAQSTLLKVLLRQRHWQSYGTFRYEYDKAAKRVDAHLVGSWPSRAQFNRWLAGQLKGLPYPDHCRVLEEMLPGFTVDELFRPYDGQVPILVTRRPDNAGAAPLVNEKSPASRFAGIRAAYATRSEFASDMPPSELFKHAKDVCVAGLSLNLLCQQYADTDLCDLIEGGASFRCLFLDPDGEAIKAREEEEGYAGSRPLAALTRINLEHLMERVRARLSPTAKGRLEIGIYDETIRFNLIVIDRRMAVVQPYLPATRGVDSPTFVIHNDDDKSMFRVFATVFESLWQRRREL